MEPWREERRREIAEFKRQREAWEAKYEAEEEKYLEQWHKDRENEPKPTLLGTLYIFSLMLFVLAILWCFLEWHQTLYPPWEGEGHRPLNKRVRN